MRALCKNVRDVIMIKEYTNCSQYLASCCNSSSKPTNLPQGMTKNTIGRDNLFVRRLEGGKDLWEFKWRYGTCGDANVSFGTSIFRKPRKE